VVTPTCSNLTCQAHIALATVEEMHQLQSWFKSAEQQHSWGGDNFDFPCSAARFLQQLNRPGTQSFSLRKSAEDPLLGFGQICDRFSCHHLARLVICPEHRGQGLAKMLIVNLIKQAFSQQQRDISLYVHRHNVIAIQCYQSLGFTIRKPPEPENARLYFMMLSAANAALLLQQR